MNDLSSTEFRKRYHTLTDVTAVTVNGHIIGTWIPVSARLPIELKTLMAEASPDEQREFVRAITPELTRELTRQGRFSTRPFTPVPKSRSK